MRLGLLFVFVWFFFRFFLTCVHVGKRKRQQQKLTARNVKGGSLCLALRICRLNRGKGNDVAVFIMMNSLSLVLFCVVFFFFLSLSSLLLSCSFSHLNSRSFFFTSNSLFHPSVLFLYLDAERWFS